MADGDFTKGCLAAVLAITLIVCAAAFVWMVIGGPRM